MNKIITCRDCGEVGERKKKWHGRRCHECFKARKKVRRQTPARKAKEKEYEQSPKQKAYRKKYQKKYNQSPKRKAYHKKYEQSPEGKAHRKEYRQSPERKAAQKKRGQLPMVKAYQKEYRHKHREFLRAYQVEYRESPEGAAKIKKYEQSPDGKATKKKYEQSSERKAGRQALAAKRKTRITKAGGSFTPAEWKALCDFYGSKCLACGEVKPLTADHIIPISKGGSSNIKNIQPLCLSCNISKGNRHNTDYRTKPFVNIQLKLYLPGVAI